MTRYVQRKHAFIHTSAHLVEHAIGLLWDASGKIRSEESVPDCHGEWCATQRGAKA